MTNEQRANFLGQARTCGYHNDLAGLMGVAARSGLGLNTLRDAFRHGREDHLAGETCDCTFCRFWAQPLAAIKEAL